MSTAQQEKIRVRSAAAGARLILKPTVQEYDLSGRSRIVEKGTQIKFENGMAFMPAELLDEFKAHPGYGSDYFLDDDLGAPAHGGPIVVDGSFSAQKARRGGDPPPAIANWSKVRTAELLAKIESGEVDASLVDAVAYEAANRCRSQVMTALQQRIRVVRSGDDENPGDEPAEEAA